MTRSFVLPLLICLALASPRALGADWEQVDRGMSQPQVAAVLGAPLIIHGGHGYVQWTYDAGGAVMFHGGVVLFWDVPAGYRPAAAPVTIQPPALVAAEFPKFQATTENMIATPPEAAPDSLLATPALPATQTTAPAIQTRVRGFAEIAGS